MTWNVEFGKVAPGDVRRIIATLPEWFGLPQSNEEYVAAAGEKETAYIREGGHAVGVAILDRHFSHVVEVHFMAVERSYHGRGIGTALIAAIESNARAQGVRLLEVKTLGPAHPDPGYAQTRHFYESVGFLPLEETDLWGEDNPCLIMVKPL
ncbi:GNAT family N-acetyltransferase [Neoactinobaculum massilliense]|uniref:GNAT family N-acetyltransferase n=1 Tax=Neoactinobaculum massilliense TaxID=2364794 RepID=UPI000F51B8DC|nr:GNAT family N-acetyltransferase [Neoactinobaculum massilliense]